MSHETLIEQATVAPKQLSEVEEKEASQASRQLSSLAPSAEAFAESFPWNHVYEKNRRASRIDPPRRILILALLSIQAELSPAQTGRRKMDGSDDAYYKTSRLTVGEITECILALMPQRAINESSVRTFISSVGIRFGEKPYTSQMVAAVESEKRLFRYGSTDLRDRFDTVFADARSIAQEAFTLRKSLPPIPYSRKKSEATRRTGLTSERRSTHYGSIDARSKRIEVQTSGAPAFRTAKHIHEVERYLAGDLSFTLPLCFSVSEGAFYSRELGALIPGVRIDITKKLLKTKETKMQGDISWTLTKELVRELPDEDIIFADELKSSSLLTTLFGRFATTTALILDIVILDAQWTGTGTRVATRKIRKLLMVRETALVHRAEAQS